MYIGISVKCIEKYNAMRYMLKFERKIYFGNFKILNRSFKIKPYPMLKLQENIVKLEGFKYATSFLNHGIFSD